MTDSSPAQAALLALVSELVAAYVANNRVPVAELPTLVATVHQALRAAPTPETAEANSTPLKPAVSVKKSVQPESITCLECGAGFKMLKRHLAADHDMTPDAYRARWNLPPDYPMTAPDYAKARSELAVKIGLGRNTKSAA
ncbi:MAG: MucR family transcriptional regulator [Rhodospirillaceae bacterium]